MSDVDSLHKAVIATNVGYDRSAEGIDFMLTYVCMNRKGRAGGRARYRKEKIYVHIKIYVYIHTCVYVYMHVHN